MGQNDRRRTTRGAIDPPRAAPHAGRAGAESAPNVQQAMQAPLRPAAAMTLQRVAGNRATGRAIMRFGEQVRRMRDDVAPEVGEQGGEISPETSADIVQSQGDGQPLDTHTAQTMGAGMSADFSRVRVHTDNHADVLNRSLGATAFTHGADVYFSEGAYNPGSRDGRQLLAHELTHVVQQTGRVQRLMTRNAWQRSTKSWFNTRGANNPELLQIDAFLNTYHTFNNVNDADRSQRLQLLTNIETTAYAWYNRRFNQDNPAASKRLTAFYNLLDDVAEEHEALIHENTQAAAPLPISTVGAHGLVPGTPAYIQAQADWQTIVNETGSIIFSTANRTGVENYPDFKRKMLPHFAKLMRTAGGRDLIHALLTETPGGMNAGDIAANRDKMTVRPTGTDERAAGRVAAAGVKRYEAYRIGDADRAPGQRGIGSYLSASPVGSETSVTRNGGGHDTRGNNLLSPMFIILAHEMIHVLHNARGTNRNQTVLPNWDNLEEKMTITGLNAADVPTEAINEQAIRNDYGLNQARFGH